MFLFLSEGAANQPDENQSGRDDWTNRQVGPARSEMIRHPYAGANL
jgi:hypothetical protein